MEIDVPVIENLTKPDKKRVKGLAPRKKAMIEAIGRSLGIIKIACKEVGITRETHRVWLRDDPEYKKAFEELREGTEDIIEQALLSVALVDKNPQVLMYVAKSKLKNRGYGEEQTIHNAGTGGFKLVIEDGRQGSKVETKSEAKSGV